MQIDPEEIEQLLHRIDQDTQRIKQLEGQIEMEQSAKQQLEKRLLALEEQQAKSSFQQSRMLRERDSVVREMSVEIDSISARLKNRVIENTDWKKKYRKLEQMYEELEVDFFQLKERCEDLSQKLEEKDQELKQIRDIMSLYQQLKKDVKLQEKWKQQEHNLITFKANEISKYYQKLKQNLVNDHKKFKQMIVKSMQVPITNTSYVNSVTKSEKNDRGMLEQKVVMLSKDNLYLKKELLRVLAYMMNKEAIDTRANTQVDEKSNEKKNHKKEIDQIIKPDDDIDLKGSILSFSNNKFNDISNPSKIESPEETNFLLAQDKLQGSSVINFQKFQTVNTKPCFPAQPMSLQVSRNRCNISYIFFCNF